MYNYLFCGAVRATFQSIVSTLYDVLCSAHYAFRTAKLDKNIHVAKFLKDNYITRSKKEAKTHKTALLSAIMACIARRFILLTDGHQRTITITLASYRLMLTVLLT